MSDKTPLKFEFDNTTPSSVAEFTSSDTVPEVNGGTGVSSLSDLGPVSSTNVSATTIDTVNFFATNASSTNVSATNMDSVVASSVNFFTPDAGAFNCMGLDGQKFFMKRENGATYENLIRSEEGTITVQSEDDIHFLSNTGEKFMRLNESGGNGEVELYYNNSLKLETVNTGVEISGGLSAVGSVSVGSAHITANTVSATSVSANTTLVVGTCPIPNPFGYIQLTANDTLSTDEKRVGYSNTPTSVMSESAHMSWNDSLKQFEVSAAGTYEVVARVVFEGGSGLVQMKIVKDTTAQNTATPRVHTTVDPVERTLSAIFTCVAGDPIYVTYDSQSSNTVGAATGTTITVKRLK